LAGDDGTERSLGFGALSVVDVVDVQGHCHRGQNGDDDNDHHQLHQREALLILRHATSSIERTWLSALCRVTWDPGLAAGPPTLLPLGRPGRLGPLRVHALLGEALAA